MFVKGLGTGKILLICEDCKKERVVKRNTDVINKEEHPCRSCSNKRNGIKKRGIPSWNTGLKKPEYQVQKGAKYIDNAGYVQVYVGEEEASRSGRKGKYMLEHRYVVQKILGRSLYKEEIIHHIDGNKQNNSIENLYLCRSLSEHRDIHNQLERLAFDLLQRGIIKFNDGQYIYAR